MTATRPMPPSRWPPPSVDIPWPTARKCPTYAERYIHSGDKLYIEGRIRYRTYDDQQGRRRYVTEIQADTLEMLVSKNPRQEERREEKPSNQEEAPF